MNLNRRTLLTGVPAIALTTTALTSTGFTPAQAATNFRDVPPGTQFYREIMWMRSSGISTGWADNTYRPLDVVRRDAMAAFLYRLMPEPRNYLGMARPFSDIRLNDPFSKEIYWMGYERISLSNNGYYLPHQPVNRDAMAAFIYRVAGHPFYTPPTRSPFRDITPNTQFYKEMCWMKDAGISTGYPDGTYRPLEPVRRDAMAAFLYRLKHNPPKFPVRMGVLHLGNGGGGFGPYHSTLGTDFIYGVHSPNYAFKVVLGSRYAKHTDTVTLYPPAGATHFSANIITRFRQADTLNGSLRFLVNGKEVGRVDGIGKSTKRTISTPISGAGKFTLECIANTQSSAWGYIFLMDSRFERR
ncbi:S-layer homology domain-containing protein [Rothia nasimurium]|uniref:S-layer homology domain-containing protein n=1 Tax=Rothia nasimurium TaxID=85336 RepID=UPI001F3D42B3|nr:S-layer homology domain-containing protein [Rothia nasimurium]